MHASMQLATNHIAAGQRTIKFRAGFNLDCKLQSEAKILLITKNTYHGCTYVRPSYERIAAQFIHVIPTLLNRI